jgi:hypothetical protein
VRQARGAQYWGKDRRSGGRARAAGRYDISARDGGAGVPVVNEDDEPPPEVRNNRVVAMMARQKGSCAILGVGRLAGANARGKAAVLQHANSRRFAGQVEMLGNGFRDGRDRVGCELLWSVRL